LHQLVEVLVGGSEFLELSLESRSASEESAVTEREGGDPPQVTLEEEEVRLVLFGREVYEVIGAVSPDERRFQEIDVDESDDGFDRSDEGVVERREVSGVVLEEETFDCFPGHLLRHPECGGSDFGFWDQTFEFSRFFVDDWWIRAASELESFGYVAVSDSVVAFCEHSGSDF
jgi:hypothetical protein